MTETQEQKIKRLEADMDHKQAIIDNLKALVAYVENQHENERNKT